VPDAPIRHELEIEMAGATPAMTLTMVVEIR
jgi:hypothetical protein